MGERFAHPHRHVYKTFKVSKNLEGLAQSNNIQLLRKEIDLIPQENVWTSDRFRVYLVGYGMPRFSAAETRNLKPRPKIKETYLAHPLYTAWHGYII